MARIHCPDSWVSFNKSCYLFSKTSVTFFGAWPLKTFSKTIPTSQQNGKTTSAERQNVRTTSEDQSIDYAVTAQESAAELTIKVICKSHGSHLAYVESEQENIFIKAHLMDLKDSSYWIGLTDLYLEGVFYWYGTGVPTGFADWFPGEPNNYEGHEHCVHYRAVGNTITWNDDSCGKSFRFICEK